MVQPKKILFLINGLGPGGAERQLLYLFSRLDRERFAPMICTVYDDSVTPAHPAYVEQLEALEVPRYTLAHAHGWSGRASAMQRLIALHWRLHPEIVQGFMHYANLLARAARPLCPPHRLYTSARNSFFPGEIRSEAYTWWLDDLLICNAPHVRQQVLEQTRRPARKVLLIPNGIPVERFVDNPDPGLRQRLFGDVPVVLGFVGRVAVEKNLPTLINALAQLSEATRQQIRVFLLGETNDRQLWRSLQAMIEQHQLQTMVRWLEPVADVRPYYRAADVILLPSLMEGVSNVAMEVCAAGRPLMVSADANRAGLVQPGVNGWQFDTLDAAQLAQLIERVVALPAEERAAYGAHGRQRAERYSVEAMTSQYAALYSTGSIS